MSSEVHRGLHMFQISLHHISPMIHSTGWVCVYAVTWTGISEKKSLNPLSKPHMSKHRVVNTNIMWGGVSFNLFAFSIFLSLPIFVSV